MEFNSLIFPAPKVDIKEKEKQLQNPQILNIPKKLKNLNYCISQFTSNKQQNNKYIPCKIIYYQNKKLFSDKIMIYFHGNAEDILGPSVLIKILSNNLQTNVLLVEYPGYGFYEGKCNAQNIESDAQDVYDFLIQKNINPKNIIVFGRSIGTGPAFYLASKNLIGVLIVMSPFTNIQEAAKHLVGSILSKIVKQRFQNDERIKQIQYPIFIIHGIKDNIIPFCHSQKLVKLSNSKKLGFEFPKNMTHNQFELHNDVLNPLIKFLNKIDFKIEMVKNNYYDFLQTFEVGEINITQKDFDKINIINQ